MIILKSRESVSDFLDTKKNKSIGLVPTMGALHEGHLSLIKLSRHVCEITVVSIFVNPRQFAPHEDFDEYPRSLQPDLDACESLGVTAVFVPNVDTIYPKYDLTKNYTPSKKLASILCGKSRPHFFGGVCQVVARLFDILSPTHAFFGEKDLQQYVIIKQMVSDLNLSIKIIPGAIIRDENGLAKSSRNTYLTESSYKQALMVPNALKLIKEKFNSGIINCREIKDEIIKQLTDNSLKIDYLEFFNPANQELVTETITEECFCCIAVICDGVRLIDNCSMKN